MTRCLLATLLVACGGASASPGPQTIDVGATDAGAALVVAPAAASSTPVARADAGDEDEALLAAIRPLSDNERVIPRAVADRILERMPELTRAARIVPEIQNGQPTGLRVFGVRPDGLFGRLGLQNGDRIDRLAGRPITSPDTVLETYSTIRRSSRVELDVTRRGAPVQIVIRIE